MANLLSIVTFIPAVAALILAIFLRGEDEAANGRAKMLALVATSVTFLVSLFIMGGFDPANTDMQFVEDREWLGPELQDGSGRYQRSIRHVDHLYDAVSHSGQLGC